MEMEIARGPWKLGKPTLVWRLRRAVDLDIEIAKVVLVGDSTNTGHTAIGIGRLDFAWAVCYRDGNGMHVRLSH